MKTQQTSVNQTAVGVQRTGVNLRVETARSNLQDPIGTQWLGDNPRDMGAQWTSVNPRARMVCSHRQISAGTRKRIEDLRGTGEVLTIIEVPHIARDNHSARDIYTKEARNSPQVHVHW